MICSMYSYPKLTSSLSSSSLKSPSQVSPVLTMGQFGQSAEQRLNDFFFCYAKMFGHVRKDSSQCANFDRVVIGNDDMMLAI